MVAGEELKAMLDVNKFQDKGVVHSSMFGKRQRAWSEGSKSFFFFCAEG